MRVLECVRVCVHVFVRVRTARLELDPDRHTPAKWRRTAWVLSRPGSYPPTFRSPVYFSLPSDFPFGEGPLSRSRSPSTTTGASFGCRRAWGRGRPRCVGRGPLSSPLVYDLAPTTRTGVYTAIDRRMHGY